MNTKRIILSAALAGAIALPAGILAANANWNDLKGVKPIQSGTTVHQSANASEIGAAKEAVDRNESANDPSDNENEPSGPDTDNVQEGPGSTADGGPEHAD